MPNSGVKVLQDQIDSAVLIKCRYCDLVSTCTRRKRKEAYQERGIVTRCTMTPNRSKRQSR